MSATQPQPSLTHRRPLVRFACLVALPLAIACGGHPGQDVRNSKGSAVDSKSRRQHQTSTRETFQASSDDVRRGLVRQFQDRNGSYWNIDGFTLGGLYDVDGFRGFIRLIWRTDALGPSVTMDAATAQAKADDFVTQNADLFGLSLEEFFSLDVAVAPPVKGNPYYENYLYFVTYSGTLVQPGYEDFPSVASKINLQVGIHQDGEIRAVLQADTVHHPDLTMSTEPCLDVSDPEVTQNVLGTELAHYEFVRQDGYRPVYHKTDLGPLEADDIVSTQLTIFLSRTPNLDAETFILAYQHSVEKGGYPFTFVVDAGTGELLDAPKAPWGEIE